MKTRINLNNNVENVTLKEAYQQFLTVKKAQNLSLDTIEYYIYNFDNFTKYFDENNCCSDISINTIYGFIEYLKKRNPDIRPVSINTYLTGIRAILYYFMEMGYTNSFRIKLLKKEETIKEIYSEYELEKLLEKPDIKKVTFPEYRNWVISCYLLGTGNRLSTLCNVKIGDLDFNTNDIILRQLKNKKQYTIPMSDTLSKTLLEYLQYRKGNPDDYLFCNQFGEKLCKDAIATAIKRYNRSRGVTKTSIHLYRHTFAKNWILNGGDMFRLQKILGHSSIEIVKRYVNMFGGDLKNDFDKFNPLESFSSMIKEKKAIQMKKGT